MKSLRIFTLLVASFLLSGVLLGNDSEKGAMDVYGSYFHGKQTASGEVYQPKALTAAHASIPFGTMVRVANFDTGRMVDVRINDRKPNNGALLRLSKAAGEQLGIPANRTVQGSLMVLGMARPPAAPQNPVQGYSSSSIQNQAQQQAQARVQPYSDQMAADPRYQVIHHPNAAAGAAVAPTVTKAKTGFFKKQQAAQAAIPSSEYQTYVPNQANAQAPKKEGLFANLFKGKSNSAQMPPPSDYASGSAVYGMQNQQTIPMSANGARTAAPGQPLPQNTALYPGNAVHTAPVQPSPQVRAPVSAGASSYRVQFGAFRRVGNATELSQALASAGIPTTVVKSNATGLNLVVTNGNFRTAEEAQGWIDYEGARRGWQDRPVVIR